MEEKVKSNSWLFSRIRFAKVRPVKTPTRANVGDAGIDFYVPDIIHRDDIIPKNANPGKEYILDSHGLISKIILNPNSRVLIPSGIRVLLEPQNSMLQANNKSGVSTKKGLIFSAEVVDSPYTGEIHIGVINTSSSPVEIVPGEKLIQFIHIPIFLDTLEEIDGDTYDKLAKNWGTRGGKGFGSSDGDLDDIDIDIEEIDILTGTPSSLNNELNSRGY